MLGGESSWWRNGRNSDTELLSKSRFFLLPRALECRVRRFRSGSGSAFDTRVRSCLGFPCSPSVKTTEKRVYLTAGSPPMSSLSTFDPR